MKGHFPNEIQEHKSRAEVRCGPGRSLEQRNSIARAASELRQPALEPRNRRQSGNQLCGGRSRCRSSALLEIRRALPAYVEPHKRGIVCRARYSGKTDCQECCEVRPESWLF